MYIFLALLTLTVSQTLSSVCDPNCNKCNQAQCLSCFQGYYLQDNVCNYCTGNCLACSSNNQCSDCIETFFNQNGLCKPCLQDCLTCSNYNSCLTCYSGFYLAQSGCRRCPQRCAVCDSATCLECVYGFYMLDSQCVFCDQNCNLCTDNIGCVECSSGYYAVSGICLECDSTCLTCTSETVCTSCVEQYYLQNQICTSCANCSNHAYCTRNGICPPVFISSTQLKSISSESGMSEPDTIIAVILPIIGAIILSFAIYKIVQKCKESRDQEIDQLEKETKGTSKTLTTSNSHFNEKQINREIKAENESQKRQSSIKQ